METHLWCPAFINQTPYKGYTHVHFSFLGVKNPRALRSTFKISLGKYYITKSCLSIFSFVSFFLCFLLFFLFFEKEAFMKIWISSSLTMSWEWGVIAHSFKLLVSHEAIGWSVNLSTLKMIWNGFKEAPLKMER